MYNEEATDKRRERERALEGNDEDDRQSLAVFPPPPPPCRSLELLHQITRSIDIKTRQENLSLSDTMAAPITPCSQKQNPDVLRKINGTEFIIIIILIYDKRRIDIRL